MGPAARRRELMDTLKAIDAEQVLPNWNRPTDAARKCFPEEWEKIARARPDASSGHTVVFLSYENPKGASGGILSVIRKLPAELRKHRQRNGRDRSSGPDLDLVRLSPLHTNLKSRYTSKELTFVSDCDVRFEGRAVKVRIHEFRDDGERWYLFGANGFFEADGGAGATDPYIYSSEDRQQRDGDESILLRDSLFASKAVPSILAALRNTRNLVIHAHDWEFASAALTVREAILDGTIESAAVLLTLHNPYDHGLSERNLEKITERHASSYWPALGGTERSTVLTRMIPLLDAPVSVVSHQFAVELTDAPIQTGVFTGHQQGVLAYQGLVGIDNGDFGTRREAAFSSAALDNARVGNAAKILAEKTDKRRSMLLALKDYLNGVDREHPETLTLGDLAGEAGASLVDLPDSIPVFMMIGRLDPGQKGYDVCAAVIESLPPGIARFVLTPMSPLARDASVRPFFDQFERLTRKRPGEVVVFAHRMTNAYKETMGGASFGLWPSRYEPFGGVSEFYVAGTPVIAHAVGGLVQQVVGYGQAPADSTGFLYSSVLPGEANFALALQYREAHDAGPEQRLSIPVYQRECDALRDAILQAIDVFQRVPAAYGRMLANLPILLDELVWEKPVQDYLQWYDVACGKRMK